MSTTRFVHYFAEGTGFLFIATLGAGTQGQAQLVLGVLDNKIYVRKTGFGDALMPYSEYRMQHNEVLLYRPHRLIPALIYHNPAFTKVITEADYNASPMPRSGLIWQYCNGGDLKNLIEQYRIQYSNEHEQIPEALIWKFLRQIVETLDHLHGLDPPIAHRDLLSGNIFCHWPDDTSRLPDFYLGDFGNAREVGADYSGNVNLFASDFHYAYLLLWEVMANPENTDRGVDIDRGTSPYSAALFHYVSRLESLASEAMDKDDARNGMPLPLRTFQISTVSEERTAPPLSTDVRWTKPVIRETPLVHETREAAVSARNIQGPWQIAVVDPLTFAVISIEPETYSNGLPPPVDPTEGGMTNSEWQRTRQAALAPGPGQVEESVDVHAMTPSEEAMFEQFQAGM